MEASKEKWEEEHGVYDEYGNHHGHDHDMIHDYDDAMHDHDYMLHGHGSHFHGHIPLLHHPYKDHTHLKHEAEKMEFDAGKTALNSSAISTPQVAAPSATPLESGHKVVESNQPVPVSTPSTAPTGHAIHESSNTSAALASASKTHKAAESSAAAVGNAVAETEMRMATAADNAGTRVSANHNDILFNPMPGVIPPVMVDRIVKDRYLDIVVHRGKKCHDDSLGGLHEKTAPKRIVIISHNP